MDNRALMQKQLQLVHLQTNTVIDLPPKFYSLRIGRTKPKNYSSNDIDIFIDISRFPDSEIISGQHFQIQRVRDKYFVEDIESGNGTYLNGSRLEAFKPLALKPGYRIDLGSSEKVSFVFTEVGLKMKLRGKYSTESKVLKESPKIKKPFFDISGFINSLVARIKKLIQRILTLIFLFIATVILILVLFKVAPLIPRIISEATTPSIPSVATNLPDEPVRPTVETQPQPQAQSKSDPDGINLPDEPVRPTVETQPQPRAQSKSSPDGNKNDLPKDTEEVSLTWHTKQIKLQPDNDSLIIAQQRKATLVKYSIYRQKELFTWVIKPSGEAWEIKATLSTKNHRQLNIQSFLKDHLALHQNIGIDESGFIAIDSLKKKFPERAESLKQIRQLLYTLLINPIEKSPQFNLSGSLIFVTDPIFVKVPFPVLMDNNFRELGQKYSILNQPQNQN